ncbi:MAG: leucine-rich repeat domain-containing protein, partial [Porcipelethomonas sp.]
MTKTIKKTIAFLSAFVMATAMLLNFPSGFFSNIDWKLTASAAEGDVAINDENFPDETFRKYVQSFDTVGNDNILSAEEIAAVTSINVSSKEISDLKGIEYFTALETLDCGANMLTSLDVSKNTALTYLDCCGNQLTSLDVSKNTELTKLYCYSNQLTSLDVSKNTALKTLYCADNSLTSLDLSQNTELKDLYCNSNSLTSLDVSGCTALETLYCSSNQLTSLDLSQNTELKDLDCSYNSLTSLDVSGCTALTYLMCYSNQLTSLDVSGCTALETLYCSSNQLTSLDLSQNTELKDLDCSYNSLTSLDVSGCTALTYLMCYSNQLTSLDVSGCTALIELYCSGNSLTSLDLSGGTAPETLDCSGNPLIAVNTSDIIWDFNASPLLPFTEKTAVICLADYGIKEDMVSDLTGGTIENGYLKVTGDKATYTYDIDGDLGENTISCTINVSGIVISKENFPDETFRAYVQTLDTVGNDNILSAEEIAAVTSIDVSYMGISDLKGIEYFTALETLYCSSNSLESLDVSKNTALIELYCSDNPLIAVNAASSISNFDASSLSSFTAKSPVIRLADYGIKEDMVSDLQGGEIKYGCLFVSDTATYTYDIDGDLGENAISCTIKAGGIEINKTNFPDANFLAYVKSFDTDNNNILSGTEIAAVTSIDVSDMGISDLKGIEYFTALETLYCSSNSLESLDVSENTALTELTCRNNSLTSLDVSQNTALESLYCNNNQLTSLDVSQNTALIYLNCMDNSLTTLDVSQ